MAEKKPTWRTLEKCYNTSRPTLMAWQKRGIDIHDPQQVARHGKMNGHDVSGWVDPYTNQPIQIKTAPTAPKETTSELDPLPDDAPPELRTMRKACDDIFQTVQDEHDPIIANRHRKDYVAALGKYHETLLRYQKGRANAGESLDVSDVESVWLKFLAQVRGAMENIGSNVSMAMDGYELDVRADVERLINNEVSNVCRILSKPVTYPTK